jgi:ubiquinone/menaquinone biosynthesis C-methylase UbiE
LLKQERAYIPRFSGMKKGDRVLDVCCGTGDQVFHYGKIGAVAAGIDFNPKMIEAGEERKEKEKHNDVFFVLTDARNLPFEDNFFDFASASLALHEMDRKSREEAFLEMKRVVKKNGKLVLLDFSVPLPKRFSSFLINSLEKFAGRKNFNNFKDYLSEGGLNSMFKKYGPKEEKMAFLKRGLFTIIQAKNKK